MENNHMLIFQLIRRERWNFHLFRIFFRPTVNHFSAFLTISNEQSISICSLLNRDSRLPGWYTFKNLHIKSLFRRKHLWHLIDSTSFGIGVHSWRYGLLKIPLYCSTFERTLHSVFRQIQSKTHSISLHLVLLVVGKWKFTKNKFSRIHIDVS